MKFSSTLANFTELMNETFLTDMASTWFPSPHKRALLGGTNIPLVADFHNRYL
jgi:hypothetical protein